MNNIVHQLLVSYAIVAVSIARASAQGQQPQEPSIPIVVGIDFSIGSAWYDELRRFESTFTKEPVAEATQKGATVELEFLASEIVSLVLDAGYHRLSLRKPAWQGPTTDLFGNRILDPRSSPALNADVWLVSTAFAIRLRTSATDAVAAIFDLGVDYRSSSERAEIESIWPRITAGVNIRSSQTPSSLRLFGGSAHGGLVVGVAYGFWIGGVYP